MNRGLAWLLGIGALATAVLLLQKFQPLMPVEPPLPVIDSLGGDITLPSTQGPGTRLSDYQGKLVLLNFGFTTCPDVCPAALSRMREVLNAVDPDGGQLQLIFVTIDPERDTIEKLRDYLAYFHPSFVGMSGSDEQIEVAAGLFKVYYQRENLESGIDYGFAHSDQIYLLDKQGRVRATFGSSVTPQQMVKDVQHLLTTG